MSDDYCVRVSGAWARAHSGIIQGDELGQPFKALWKRLDEFHPGKPPIYPAGLTELIGH